MSLRVLTQSEEFSLHLQELPSIKYPDQEPYEVLDHLEVRESLPVSPSDPSRWKLLGTTCVPTRSEEKVERASRHADPRSSLVHYVRMVWTWELVS